MVLIALALSAALAAAEPATASLNVTFRDVPDAARQDFETAARTWEGCLVSAVPINIHVAWMSSGPTGFAGHNSIRNKRYLPRRDAYYPTALASALRGKPVTTQDDINIFLRDKDNWHYAAADPIQEGDVDFINVALHEIAHGLGVSSSSFVPWDGEPIAELGRPNAFIDYFDWTFDWPPLDGTPEVYDTFIRLADGRRIVADFPNGSLELTMALANPTIHFDGKHAVDANDGFPVGVVPLNVSHIPQFPRRAPPMMLPDSGQGESYRHPDPILLGMLKDLGWEITASCMAKARAGAP